MLCDRKVVKECVKIWFGSQEAFEETVRSEVLETLTVVLSEGVFTNRWILGVTSPLPLDLSWTFQPVSVIGSLFFPNFGRTPP